MNDDLRSRFYDEVVAVIDAVKTADRPEDTDAYAGRIMAAADRIALLPGELTVLHVRDPDGYCNTTVWTADGTEVTAAEESVDAGAGHAAEEWRDRITDAEALPPSDYRTELLAALGDPPGSEHIAGWEPPARDDDYTPTAIDRTDEETR